MSEACGNAGVKIASFWDSGEVLSRHRIEPDSSPTLGKVDKQFGNHVSEGVGTKPARAA